MEGKTNPDQIIRDLGGCGRFQWRISVVAHLMKILYCWSFMSLIVTLFTPPWHCADDVDVVNGTFDVSFNGTVVHSGYDVNRNGSFYVTAEHNSSLSSGGFESCVNKNNTQCKRFKFERPSTLITEFNLVCEDDYVPSLMMSIQSAGSFVGNVVAGQSSDLFGRKRTFFGAVALMTVFNFVGLLVSDWKGFAATRFFIGIGGSAFMTAMYSLLSEFSLAQHRAWIIGTPSWPIEAMIFAGVAMLLQDWKNVQIAVTVVGIPCMMAWWVIPESFRWYLAHNKTKEAEEVLKQVARVNKKPLLTLQQLEEVNLTEGESEPDRKYTFVDIFRSRYLVKLTLLMTTVWFALGFISNGLLFGIQKLSGNIYMNTFLFSLVGVPSKFFTSWLENRIGRRKSALLCYLIAGLGGFAAGIMEYVDTPHRGAFINGFALFACIGIAAVWGPVQTMTIELYPTVIRSIGFGVLGTFARVGAILAPQFVFLSTKVPGIMFFTCGVLSTLCIVSLLGLDETKDANLNDKISETKRRISVNKL